jgi:hypothetical protein
LGTGLPVGKANLASALEYLRLCFLDEYQKVRAVYLASKSHCFLELIYRNIVGIE